MNSNDTFIGFGFVLPWLGIVFMIGLLLIYFYFHLNAFVCVCLCACVCVCFFLSFVFKETKDMVLG